MISPETLWYIVVGACIGGFLTIVGNIISGWPAPEAMLGGLLVGTLAGYFVAIIRSKE